MSRKMKKGWRLFLGTLGLLMALLVALWLSPVEPKQELVWMPGTDIILAHDSAYLASRIDSLKAEWGGRKELPEGFELPALLALSRFPELRDAHVRFRLMKSGIPLASRPTPGSIFVSRRQRIYEVYIVEDQPGDMQPFLLANLPFEAQVAMLAHELSHTHFYERLNGWQIASFGLKYALDAGFRARHERSTDALVIYKGLGWPLYANAMYLRTDPVAKEVFLRVAKEFLEEFYLSDVEIHAIMADLPAYEIKEGPKQYTN